MFFGGKKMRIYKLLFLLLIIFSLVLTGCSGGEYRLDAEVKQGKGKVTPEEAVEKEGTKIQLKAEPTNEDWQFTRWEGYLEGNEPETTVIMPAEDIKISAFFTKNPNRKVKSGDLVTQIIEGQGKIRINGKEREEVEVAAGERATLEAHGLEDENRKLYEFARWKVENSTLEKLGLKKDNLGNRSIIISEVPDLEESLIVKAAFTPVGFQIDHRTVKGSGQINIKPEPDDKFNHYPYGTEVTITAEKSDDSDYSFSRWEDNILVQEGITAQDLTDPSITFNVERDLDFQAVFEVPMEFECNYLEEALREKFELDQESFIFPSYFKPVESLKLSDYYITSLRGLEAGIFNNLKEIDFSVNQIEDLKGLEKIDLSKLRTIEGGSNEIDSLERLAGADLSRLRVLSFPGNEIKKLNSLDGKTLNNLEVIDLRLNNIESLDGLKEVSWDNVKTLRISYNEIRDLDVFAEADLSSLRVLDFAGNEIENLTGLEGLKLANLKTFDLSSNQVTDLDPLSGMDLSNLENLDLSSNELENLSFLEGMKLNNLESFEIDFNKITDLTSLEELELSNLKSFDLSSNELEDLSSLKKLDLSSLHTLDVGYNKITDLTSLEGLELNNLKSFDLSGNELEDLSSLKKLGLSNLEILDVSSNNIANLTDLAELDVNNLRILDLAFNDINNDNLKPLVQAIDEEKLNNLESVKLGTNDLKEDDEWVGKLMDRLGKENVEI
jgi:Leucine-rich repeat (LRR) protein